MKTDGCWCSHHIKATWKPGEVGDLRDRRHGYLEMWRGVILPRHYFGLTHAFLFGDRVHVGAVL
jgi:hypothetical protein